MERPGNLSVGDLMAATVIIGLDLAAIRALWPDDRNFAKVASLALPMVGVLALGVLVLIRWRSRGMEASPFLIRFEVFGWAATAAFLACAWRYPDATRSVIIWPWEPFPTWLRSLGYHPNGSTPWWMAAHFVLLAQVVFWLQLAVAVVGGAITARYRFTVERRGTRGG